MPRPIDATGRTDAGTATVETAKTVALMNAMFSSHHCDPTQRIRLVRYALSRTNCIIVHHQSVSAAWDHARRNLSRLFDTSSRSAPCLGVFFATKHP